MSSGNIFRLGKTGIKDGLRTYAFTLEERDLIHKDLFKVARAYEVIRELIAIEDQHMLCDQFRDGGAWQSDRLEHLLKMARDFLK